MLVSGHIADIVSLPVDRPSIYFGLLTQPCSEVARCIVATTLIQRGLNKRKIRAFIIIERWNGPAGRRILRLFVHRDGTHIFIGLQDTGFLQSSQRWLFMATDTAGMLLLRIAHKVFEREGHDVITCQY